MVLSCCQASVNERIKIEGFCGRDAGFGLAEQQLVLTMALGVVWGIPELAQQEVAVGANDWICSFFLPLAS